MQKKFNQEQESVLVGLMLSDGFLEKSSDTSNARLLVQFTVLTPELFFYCYEMFKEWISEKPKIVLKHTYAGKGKLFEQNSFRTGYNSVFTEFYPIFYTKIDGENRRVIPTVRFLMEKLTDTALAVLIMGDGSRRDRKSRTYELHVQGHGFEGAARLALALKEKHNILAWPTVDNYKTKNVKYWIVTIAAQSFEVWEPKVANTLKECNMYERKMPNPRKLNGYKSNKGVIKFEQFYTMFKDDHKLREDVTYRVPSETVEIYRSLQQNKI